MTAYNFWIWKRKLLGVLYLLTQEIGTDFLRSDYDAILYGLSTADEGGFDYLFSGAETITIRLLPNTEDEDLITLSITGSEAFLQKAASIDRFQASFQNWTVENESYYTH